MRRRDFLSRLGIGAAAAVAAPQVIKAVSKEEGLVVEKEVSQEVHDVYTNWKSPSWYEVQPAFFLTKPVTKDDVMGDRVWISTDHSFRYWDTVYIDPKYTNKDIPATFVVAGIGISNYLIMPLDGSVRIIKDIPEGKIFFTGNPIRENRDDKYEIMYHPRL